MKYKDWVIPAAAEVLNSLSQNLSHEEMGSDIDKSASQSNSLWVLEHSVKGNNNIL